MFMTSPRLKSSDKEHFWLYKFINDTQELIPYDCREHVGEILSVFK